MEMWPRPADIRRLGALDYAIRTLDSLETLDDGEKLQKRNAVD